METLIAALIAQIEDCEKWHQIAFRDGSSQRMTINHERKFGLKIALGMALLAWREYDFSDRSPETVASEALWVAISYLRKDHAALI